MKKYSRILKNITTLCVIILSTQIVIGQSIATKFGKNRVQYHDDFTYWDLYETENLITYWYGKGRYVAQSVVQMAEMDHQEIQNIMEHRFNDKIEIIVYVDVTDLKQSNHGLEETFNNNTGETKIVGNKMFVYFDGNHQKLRRKIREGIATVYINSILFGSNIQEIVQNAVLLKVPTWYKQGLVSYVGESWDHEYDDELRDLLTSKAKYYDFELFGEEHPRIAGHSLWHFIDQNYGRSAISNILYLTRINRNLESSFLYVLSVDFKTLLDEWTEYNNNIFNHEEGKYETNVAQQLKLKNKIHQPISLLALSPDSRQLAYAYNDIGKISLRLLNMDTNEDKEIYKSGFRNPFQETDYNYPLVAWHPNGKELSYIYEKNDVLHIVKYYPSTDEYEDQIIPTDFHRIYSISYIDGNNYVFSANTKGLSDIYTYQFKTRQFKQLTDDFYDDLEAKVMKVNGENGIVFRSNRTDNLLLSQTLDTILPIDNFDLFFYNLEKESKTVERLTFTPEDNEKEVIFIDGKLGFINNASGMNNRYLKNMKEDDNGYPNSNKDRNIIIHTGAVSSNTYIYSDYRDGAYRCYIEDIDGNKRVEPFVTFYQNSRSSQAGIKKGLVPFVKNNTSYHIVPQMTEGYKFQSQFDDPDNIEDLTNKLIFDNTLEATTGNDGSTSYVLEENSNRVQKFVPARIVASRKKFRMDNFTTRMDNEVLFEGLESYVGQDKTLKANPLGILLKANVVDIFEDYSLEGGMRIPTTFDGSEYFLTFQNRKKRIDHTFALYRKSKTEEYDENAFPILRKKRSSILGLHKMKYPFDIYRSVSLTSSLRFDRLYYQSVNQISLEQPFDNEKRLSFKGEYIFDNSIDIDMNVKNGTRYKVYSEVINSFDLDLADGFDIKLSNGFTTVVGFDLRHYVPVLKHAVFAVRAAGATSFGSKKMLYYLGGTENWMFSQFDNTIPTPNDEQFAYKALAPTIRGFDINIRNGSSYALINAELRLPLFKLLSRREVKSSILRNFQLVMFYDVGTAWLGSSPYSKDNPLNTTTIESPPIVTLNIEYYRDPLVMGYGAGLRASLFGYYLRFDYAYGVETRKILDPKMYFSIGTDF